MTKAQEEANFHLRQHLRQTRKEHPEKDYVIKNGKVVPRAQSQSKKKKKTKIFVASFMAFKTCPA